jgi:hypothetical protein
MSQVLYAEAECITKQAFRELLVEAAKDRWRERFGDKITGLAQLAVDELLQDVVSSLEIEARINERSQARDRVKDRLHDIFREHGGERGEGRDTREGGAAQGEGEEGEGGESGGSPSAGQDEDR